MAAIAAALCTAPGLRPVPRGGTARAAAATVPLRPLLASAALQAHAPRRPSSGDLACRAEQGAEGGGSSEPENLESLSFQSLASLVVTNIASAYQGHDISGSKLAKWWVPPAGAAGRPPALPGRLPGCSAALRVCASHYPCLPLALCRLAEVSSEGVKKGAEAAGQAAQEGGGGVGGALKKAAHVAASALGARQEPREPWEAAAHYLGADALSLTPDALTSW